MYEQLMIITHEHLDADNYYIGPDISRFYSDVVLESGLGTVKFKTSLSVSGSILAKTGTGIMANKRIHAGRDIKVSDGLEAGTYIQAGTSIEAGTHTDSVMIGW